MLDLVELVGARRNVGRLDWQSEIHVPAHRLQLCFYAQNASPKGARAGVGFGRRSGVAYVDGYMFSPEYIARRQNRRAFRYAIAAVLLAARELQKVV